MSLVSIKDIAREVGVSTTTVSFVLNGKAREKRISDVMKGRIEETARRLNYRPNPLARGLRTGQSHTLALIVEDISNPFFAHLARYVEQEADHSGYTVMFCSAENETSKADRLLYLLQHRQMDGFIIVPTPGMRQGIEGLVSRGKPVVLVDRYFPDLDLGHVAIDNRQGARSAVALLASKGYRKAGIVTLASPLIQMSEREHGFLEALREHGMEVSSGRILHVAYDATDFEVCEKILEMIRREEDMDAIFFSTHHLGVSGLEAIRMAGLRIPSDLAVVSFDDGELFRLGSPSISVISQPIRDMGAAAVRLILGMIRKEPLPEKKLIFSPEVQVREST